MLTGYDIAMAICKLDYSCKKDLDLEFPEPKAYDFKEKLDNVITMINGYPDLVHCSETE